MTRHRKLHPFQNLDAILAAGRVWLLELAVWLATAFDVSPAVRAELRAELDRLHHALMLDVFRRTRMVLASSPSRTSRPVSTPRGVALAREGAVMRILWRTSRRGLGLRARVRALRAALANRERLVAHFARRLMKPSGLAHVMRLAPREAHKSQWESHCGADDSS